MDELTPTVSKILKFIAFLNFLGGIFLSIYFFNNQYVDPVTYQTVSRPLVLYGMAAIVYSGIGSVLFWAVSEIVEFLALINRNMYFISTYIKPIEEPEAVAPALETPAQQTRKRSQKEINASSVKFIIGFIIVFAISILVVSIFNK